MKKLVILLFCLPIVSIGFSQNSLEEKLLEVYSTEQSNLILNDIEQEKYYTNLAFNSYIIKEISLQKIKSQNFETLYSFQLRDAKGEITSQTPEQLIESFNNKTFNFLRLNIERDYQNTKTYLIGDTGYVIHILSYQTLSKLQKQ